MKKVQKPACKTASPIIILVRPQLAENIGMVARAMMNAGLYDLRLVSPRENHLDKKAVAASSGAAVILENAEVFETLDKAIADTNYVVATTARARNMAKTVHFPAEAANLLNERLNNNQKCAILFGAERTGLENQEIVMADEIIEIPLNPLHTSLNLSQAVLIVGYEWFKSRHNPTIHKDLSSGQSATKEELEIFLTKLENELTTRGYFRFIDKKERMQRNLRNIFTRNGLTAAEIKTLHGVLNDLIKKG